MSQIGPKWDKSGTFSDYISVHFGAATHNVQKSDPGFVPFEVILTHTSDPHIWQPRFKPSIKGLVFISLTQQSFILQFPNFVCCVCTAHLTWKVKRWFIWKDHSLDKILASNLSLCLNRYPFSMVRVRRLYNNAARTTTYSQNQSKKHNFLKLPHITKS